MTRLVASESMLRAARKTNKLAAIQRFLQLSQAGKAKSQQPKKSIQTDRKDDLKLPTPEREAKEDEGTVVLTKTPPFNSQILGVISKYNKQLGADTIMALEHLAHLKFKGDGSRGQVSRYDGFRVDISRQSYEHLTVEEAEAHNVFRDILMRMPEELRLITLEALEGDGRSKRMLELAGEVTTYSGANHRHGATVAILKIIGWHVRLALSRGLRHGKERISNRDKGV